MTIDKKKLSLIAVFLIPLLFVGFVFAKYVVNREKDLLYEAQSFYFESDLLNENTNQQSYTYQKGIDSIAINLSNNIDDLRYSEVDIKYLVSITDIDGNSITDNSDRIVEPIAGVLEKGKISNKQIIFNNLKSGVYIVTAQSVKPYKKQIQANFILNKNDNSINYEINDAVDSSVLNLVVSVVDNSNKIKISWPDGVAPDNTNSFFENVNTGFSAANITIVFPTNSEYVFNFFKKNPSNTFSTSDFSIEEVD